MNIKIGNNIINSRNKVFKIKEIKKNIAICEIKTGIGKEIIEVPICEIKIKKIFYFED